MAPPPRSPALRNKKKNANLGTDIGNSSEIRAVPVVLVRKAPSTTRSFRRRIIGIRDLVFSDKISPAAGSCLRRSQPWPCNGNAHASRGRQRAGCSGRRRPRCAAANADASRARGRRDASKVAARALSRPAAASRYFPWRAAAGEHGTVAIVAVSQRQLASRACRHHELTSLSGRAPPLSLSSCAASRPWSPPDCRPPLLTASRALAAAHR